VAALIIALPGVAVSSGCGRSLLRRGLLGCGVTRVVAVLGAIACRRCMPIARRRLRVLTVRVGVIGCGHISVRLLFCALGWRIGPALVIVLIHR